MDVQQKIIFFQFVVARIIAYFNDKQKLEKMNDWPLPEYDTIAVARYQGMQIKRQESRCRGGAREVFRLLLVADVLTADPVDFIDKWGPYNWEEPDTYRWRPPYLRY